jgi:nitronate monooxygenase
MIETWLTRTFSLDVPVIGAPMAGPGEGALAAAVSAAGGLGMVGVHAARSADWIREQATVTSASGHAWGVGLMAWLLDQDDRQLDAAIDVRPSLVSVSFGGFEPYVDRLREAGIPVAVQAGNVEEAVRAERAGVDLLVARGGEGGGHGRNEVGTLPLLQAVLDRVDVPVVAAGGIGTARGLAAVLAAGAVGAWVGTALLTTREAGTSARGRARLLAANETSTAYGRVFDVAQRISWPSEYGGRALRNDYFDRWTDRLEELSSDEAAAAELSRARAEQDYDTAYLYAGQGVGMLTEERSVADVLGDLGRAEELLRRWSRQARPPGETARPPGETARPPGEGPLDV